MSMQNPIDEPRDYRVGQVWAYKTRPGEENSRLVIVKITGIGGGDVYSIFLEDVKLLVNGEDQEPQDHLPHAPLSQAALDASVVELIETRQQLPDFEWAYQDWLDSDRKAFAISAADVLSSIEKAVAIADNPFPSVGWTRLDDGREFEAELAREVGAGHPLFHVPVKAVARAGDDVLFALPTSTDSSEPQYAQVHLTWRGSEEPPPWPTTETFLDLPSWYERFSTPAITPAPSDAPPRLIGGLSIRGWILFVILIALVVGGVLFEDKIR